MAETVGSQVAQEITSTTGLSIPDYAVLSRLEESGSDQLRQQALADSMNWSKSRLSHHLTRMQERGLVIRLAIGNEAGICVGITSQGKEVLALARPVHARAVRSYLLDRLTPDEKQMLTALAARLEAP